MGLRINKKDLLTFFIFAVFIEPALFAEIPFIDWIYIVLKAMLAVYILIRVIFSKKGISAFQICSAVFFLTLILATIINKGDIGVAFRSVFNNIVPCLYLDLLLREDSKGSIKILQRLMMVYVVINALLLILFPQGFNMIVYGRQATDATRLNFLGKDNTFIYLFIPAIVLTILDDNDEWYNKLLVIGLCLFSMIYVWSGTGLIVCVLIVIYAVFLQGKRIDKIFSVPVLTAVYIACFLGIVVFRIQDKFAWLFVDILHKNLDFTGRIYLWDASILKIIQSPWTGYGITGTGLIERHGNMYSPHNLFLQILIAGGVASFISFLILYFLSIHKLKWKKYKCANLISFAIFSYLIGSLTESTMNVQYLYLLFALAYNVDLIESNMDTIHSRIVYKMRIRKSIQ